MKKSIIITIASVVVFVPLLLLAISINENKAEQKTITAAAHAAQTKTIVPQIKKFEPRSSEWGKYYQRQ